MTQAIHDRAAVLYLAPWVDVGGADKGTVDWFRFLDRTRFRPSLITTQPSPNRRLREVAPCADELWELPQLMRGDDFPRFILAFIQTRGIKVVHIMNSRLGFELLPQIATLPDRPRVVVQLHVEEPDRSGYVRYVTTRYGNLVDAFSVSTQALSVRLGAYDVPNGKRRVIATGVDAEREFCPGRVRPIEGLDDGRFQLVFPVRLTAQKDPLLMLDVATRVRAGGLPFQIHVLGDGDLTDVVREQVARRGLQREVALHGACLDVARWYRACDAVLLTSEFEGLPYVAYEAMAMGLPIVTPRLPGSDELVTPDTGVLISPRGDAQAYADAIAALAADAARCKRMGAAARSRVRSQFSLERMAAEHGALYGELLKSPLGPDRRPASLTNGSAPPPRPAGAFRSRKPGATPLVTVIVPCFNHGLYLPDCMASIARQTYKPIETIVVDDGSTDAETLTALDMLERQRCATVVRLQTNRGPGAARNAAIERACGRYVLPVDADNLLLPSAIADLVEQLSAAGEQIGFVYPNLQFFGNRTDYLEATSYNLHALLGENQCDTSSLIDREVFDHGFRYAEDIGLAHEDWDFVLTLAENGIYGEPARAKTLLSRKHGFTRSDLVAAGVEMDHVAQRHPRLFGSRARIKGEWNPSVTVIGLDPLPADAGETIPNVVAAASRQTCGDFELIVRANHELWPTELGRRLRRIPSTVGASRAHALAQCLELARGRYVLATYGSPAALLADPAMIEKVLRVHHGGRGIAALALAESEPRYSSFGLLDSDDAGRASLGALCWSVVGPLAPPPSLPLAGALPLETIARWLGVHGGVQWRHVPRRDRRFVATTDGARGAMLGAPRHVRAGDARFREVPPALPECRPGIVREGSPGVWTPPQTWLLCRHVHSASGRYVHTHSPSPPADCTLQHVLGAVRAFPFPGTTSLLISGGEDSFAFGEHVARDDPSLLGFVEQAPLPLFNELQVGRHPGSGQQLLFAGASDPLAGTLADTRVIGYLEPYPIHPRLPPHVEVTYGLVGLVRTVDRDARRHRYGAGWVPRGVAAGELGAMFRDATGDCEPLWIDDQGWVLTRETAHRNGRPSLRSALRWTGAPLTWTSFSRPGPKLRASARRAYDSARMLAHTGATAASQPSEPTGYLLRSPTSRTVPLYAATHPVTGDQLLSNSPSEPSSLGYRDIALLGHLVAEAPVTGTLGAIRPATPWASRFGDVAVS